MKRLVIAIVVMGLVVAGYKYLYRGSQAVVTGQLTGDGIGQMAPDFILETPEGKPLRLSDYRGKAVVLNFWATWCPPCHDEAPLLVQVKKVYEAQGLAVIGVAVDSERDDIADFVKRYGVNFPIVLATEELQVAYGNSSVLPHTFFIDRSGKVVEHNYGALESSETYRLARIAMAAGR